MEACEHVR